MTSGVPVDQSQRIRALDTSNSFCVQSPAGSGKTELLTRRIMKLLTVCNQPEEILAITFTRKAAAEMRGRLLENLQRAQALGGDDLANLPSHELDTLEMAREVLARDKEQEWSLMENTSRLRISTIDSFNHFLTSQLPVTSALGIIPEISDDTYSLFQQAVLDTLRELDSDSDLSRALATLLAHFNNNWNSLQRYLCDLLSKRDQWLGNILDIRHHPEQARALLENTLVELVEQTLRELEEALLPYLADMLPLLSFAADNLRKDGSTALYDAEIVDALPACLAGSLAQWREVTNILLTDKGHLLRKRLTDKEGFPAATKGKSKVEKDLRKEMKDAMGALLDRMRADSPLPDLLMHFRYLPDPGFDDNQWQVLQSLTVILPELVSRLSLVFAEHVRVDHAHISAAALDALGDEERPTDLALRLDYHLRHILVDEFQDTSTFQIHLLEKLTRGWQPGDGRTLFIVGDGMQSCYGFRNANVGLFLAARDKGIGSVMMEPLQLVCNFRSQAPVVEWVNEIFQHAFPLEDDISRGAVRFHPAEAVHGDVTEGETGGIEVNLLVADKDLPDSKILQRLREADLVADKVLSLRSQYPGDSIAILVRTRTHLNEIIPALRARSLQWNATEIDPLDSYTPISDLLMLTRALLNPADTAAWLALLRAPWMGLALTDIHRISRLSQDDGLSLWQAMCRHQDIDSLSGDARLILSRVVPALSLARNNRGRQPLREWIENLWVLLGGPACIDDPAITDNISQFFSLLEKHDAGGDITDIHRFENEVSNVHGSGQNPDARLHIMTIHRAKGLEFDHVIVPGLDRGTRPNENPLLLWKQHITPEGEDRLIISLPSRKGKEIEKDRIYQYLKYELEMEQRLEATRLLYIAVTRAIKSACLYASVTEKEGVYSDPGGQQSLLATIWPQLVPRLQENFCRLIQVGDGSPMEVEEETIEAQILTRRLPPNWQPALTPAPAGEESARGGSFDELFGDAAHHNLLEKTAGDIIHYCMKLYAEGKLDPFDPARIEDLEPWWRLQLAPHADDPDAAVAGIHAQLIKCREHDRFAWLVEHAHGAAASELSLSDFTGGIRREYVVDRTFIDTDGQRWIIDYKSSPMANGESLDAFLSRQEEKYLPQLRTYASLFRTMEDRPVRCALFFTALPHFHEIDVDGAGPGEQNSLF